MPDPPRTTPCRRRRPLVVSADDQLARRPAPPARRGRRRARARHRRAGAAAGPPGRAAGPGRRRRARRGCGAGAAPPARRGRRGGGRAAGGGVGAAVELGAERVAVLPADEAWLLSRVGGGGPVAGGARAGWSPSVAAAAAQVPARWRPPWRWPRRPAPCSSTPTRGEAGSTCCSAPSGVEGLRWPELTGLRGRVGGDALLAALPEVGGVHVLAASRSAPVDDAGRGADRRRRGRPLRWAGPVVVDLPRAVGATARRRRSSPTPTWPCSSSRPGCGPATAARLLVDAPGSAWAARRARRAAGARRAARGTSVADVVGPAGAGRRCRTTAAPCPAASAGSRPPSRPRSPLGGLARRVLAGPCAAEAAG